MNGMFCCLVHVRRFQPHDMCCSSSGASVSTGECQGALRKSKVAGQPVLCEGACSKKGAVIAEVFGFV
jgi:hypothetical protein